MKMEYEMPSVEVINFIALQRLANTREQIEARDNAAQQSDGGNVGGPAISEDVIPW